MKTEGNQKRLDRIQKEIDEEVRKRANAKMLGEEGMRSTIEMGGLHVPLIKRVIQKARVAEWIRMCNAGGRIEEVMRGEMQR